MKRPILWPLDAKSRFTGKDPDAGKGRGQKEKWVAEEMVRKHHQLGGAWHAAVHGVTKSRMQLTD